MFWVGDMKAIRRASSLALWLLASVIPAAANPLSAQDEARRLIRERTGQEVTQAAVLEQIRASGLSRGEARSLLRQSGYDSTLAEPYFDELEGRRLGQVPATDAAGAAPPLPVPAAEPRRESEVFGRNIFSGVTTQFQAIAMGPVDSGYRLGPGDQIILILTGDVEFTFTLDVTREGLLVIPDVGQVYVNGLTLEALRNQLYERLGRVYSGVRRDASATTHFDVSLGRLRMNQVFVIGDVERPGAYQVSSVATVFNALYSAGGPTDVGSFRSIQVRRRGQVVQEIDVYDYLLRGDASKDVRLEQGDIVFIPPSGAQVRIAGRVRREAMYELREGEGLRDVVAFAGGFDPSAHVQRIQIDRILPPAERGPGRDRVLVDVSLGALEAGSQPLPLKAGDVIDVFGVLNARRNRVTIQGAIHRPGIYEYEPGMSLWTLIERADGLVPSAFRAVAHVTRRIEATETSRLVRVSLEADAGGTPIEDLPLADLDEVVVYATENLNLRQRVTIHGEVKSPGEYPLAENMTVEDLIFAAGGFTQGAQSFEAEVVRPRIGIEHTDTVAVVQKVRLEGTLPDPLGVDVSPLDGAQAGLPRGSEFVLRNLDRVVVRRLPGYVASEAVEVQGEVMYPGTYVLQSRSERLSSVLRRAGGPTLEADLDAFRLVRDNIPVGVDLRRALERPGNDIADPFVEAGDMLVLSAYDPTVLVQGAVAFESRVLYREGRDLDEYISRAGGLREDADGGRISVEYANGERATFGRFLLFKRAPSVRAGSVIYVPAKDPDRAGADWDQILSRTLTVLSTLATVALAASQISR